jgi:rSAM/selenodomain-associated transferase 2
MTLVNYSTDQLLNSKFPIPNPKFPFPPVPAFKSNNLKAKRIPLNGNISLIIPTYNEAAGIGPLVQYLQAHGGDALADLLVVDAGSTDDTVAQAVAAGARAVVAPEKGRAAQMNYGASLARGTVLYFVHADSFPPPGFVQDINAALQRGADLGRYRTKFDSPHPLLRFNEWFTRFDLFICMGGDQTLFIRKELFDRLGGFRPEMRIMEEYEFCHRARQQGRYVILPGAARISARKYEKNSWWQVQRANYTVVKLYKKGASQEEMVQAYKTLLRW